MPNNTHANDGGTCGQSADSADNVRTRKHELKTDPVVFNRVRSGEKTYEIRRDDREYAVGDFLLLRKTRHTGLAMAEGSPLIYTGDTCLVCVTHILRGPVYGLSEGWVIMSIRHITDTPMMPTPASYGEPWEFEKEPDLRPGDDDCDFTILSDALGKKVIWHCAYEGDSIDGLSLRRAVQCVNACKGIADPVEALKAARDALEEAIEIADAFNSRIAGKKFRRALAKLNPA